MLTVCLYVSPDFVLPYQETGSDESSSLFVSDNLHSQDWRGGGGDGRDERLRGNNKQDQITNISIKQIISCHNNWLGCHQPDDSILSPVARQASHWLTDLISGAVNLYCREIFSNVCQIFSLPSFDVK